MASCRVYLPNDGRRELARTRRRHQEARPVRTDHALRGQDPGRPKSVGGMLVAGVEPQPIEVNPDDPIGFRHVGEPAPPPPGTNPAGSVCSLGSRSLRPAGEGTAKDINRRAKSAAYGRSFTGRFDSPRRSWQSLRRLRPLGRSRQASLRADPTFNLRQTKAARQRNSVCYDDRNT